MGRKHSSEIFLGGKSVSAQIFFRPPAGDAAPALASTRLTRRGAITETVRRAVVERIRASNPAGAKQFDAASRQNDIVKLFADDAMREGIDANDVGDIAALYWITAWSVVHRHSPTTEEIAAVRAQVRHALAHAEELADASDEEKQRMADDMIFQLMLLKAAFAQASASRNEAALDMLATSTYRTALENEVDLRAMDLGERGLVAGTA